MIVLCNTCSCSNNKMQLLPLLYWCTQCYSHIQSAIPYTQEMNGTMLDTFFFRSKKYRHRNSKNYITDFSKI